MSFEQFLQNLRAEGEVPTSREPEQSGSRNEDALEAINPKPVETARFQEWNEGDELPNGGPLPLDKATRTVISALMTYGTGTKEDPMVIFPNKEDELMKRRSRRTIEAHVAFAKQVARRLKFSHIWIRKAAYKTEVKRDGGAAGLYNENAEKAQSHLTVLLGNSLEWVIVGGHIFVSIKADGGLEYVPSEKMSSHSPGRISHRVIELWKWDEEQKS
ncbi:hypothetical protein F4861DRAFT_550850 [Xylaria intraflava]|nr:hypothetical protein F4861DRAFT_550850 [Xylaria intraflava]